MCVYIHKEAYYSPADTFSICGLATTGTTVWMNLDRSPLPRMWPLAAQFIKPATQVFATQVQI